MSLIQRQIIAESFYGLWICFFLQICIANDDSPFKGLLLLKRDFIAGDDEDDDDDDDEEQVGAKCMYKLLHVMLDKSTLGHS